MKKIFLFLAVSMLTLASCSSDDNNDGGSGVNSNMLVKRLTQTDSEGMVTTLTASYNGNKVSTLVDADGTGLYFTYSGDNITKVDVKFTGFTILSRLYTYDAQGRLATFVSQNLFAQEGAKEVYTYNANGNISVAYFVGTTTSQTEPVGTGTIEFTNGEVTHIMSTPYGMHTYTYDDKNSPLRNVTGYSKISFTEGAATGINRNILTDVADDYSSTTSYQYNTDNFPTTATTVSDDGTTESVEFFYE